MLSLLTNLFSEHLLLLSSGNPVFTVVYIKQDICSRRFIQINIFFMSSCLCLLSHSLLLVTTCSRPSSVPSGQPENVRKGREVRVDIRPKLKWCGESSAISTLTESSGQAAWSTTSCQDSQQEAVWTPVSQQLAGIHVTGFRHASLMNAAQEA